jgi:hypothetical protein
MTNKPEKNADEPVAAWESEGGAPAEPLAPSSAFAALKAALLRMWSALSVDNS